MVWIRLSGLPKGKQRGGRGIKDGVGGSFDEASGGSRFAILNMDNSVDGGKNQGLDFRKDLGKRNVIGFDGSGGSLGFEAKDKEIKGKENQARPRVWFWVGHLER